MSFSETQFTFGYLNELYELRRHSHLYPFGWFGFPSQPMERFIPFDFCASHYTHSEFYQFKRSHFFGRRRGNAEIKAGVPAAYLPYYRFEVYNRTTAYHLGQFEKIVQLAGLMPNDLMYYCAPCFHTENDFIAHFYNRTIHNNVVLIECHQFNDPQFLPPNFDINSGRHYMAYKTQSNIGYLCSDAIKIKLSKTTDISPLKEVRQVSRSNPYRFQETLNMLYEMYLQEDINMQKIRTEELLVKFTIVYNYLLANYDIVWQPMFTTT